MKHSFIVVLTFWCGIIFSQNDDKYEELTVKLQFKESTDNIVIPFVNATLLENQKSFVSNAEGFLEFEIETLPQDIKISVYGYQTKILKLDQNNFTDDIIEVKLDKDILGLEEVVITGTRNELSKRSSPVLVNTINSRALESTQSNTLAEGLNFSPGVRVETNCQNCGFTQVRLNGLQGSYTQILVNSRPIFTSLLGVYGLEQIPVNSIQNIEIVRGGGSALYGSNAIAGTVNVITKDPVLNTWDISSTVGIIDSEALNTRLDFNSSVVSDDLKSGVRFYGNYRKRESYDANNDGFTELVELESNSIGANAYLKPNDLSRLSVNLNSIHEYRRGGDRLELAPQFTDITEELDHSTFIGGINYDLNSIDQTKTLDAYASVSRTNRDSYYGGLGGKRTPQDSISANNAFGNTKDLALNIGLKLTKSFSQDADLTLGAEYNLNDTRDDIEGYNRIIDQQVSNIAIYTQYKLRFAEKFTSLIGARFDYIDVNGLYQVEEVSRTADLDQTAISPRLSLAYDLNDNQKIRAGYARGFRAPQAFNEDLHISSVGGEQLFVILSEDLETEYSDALTLSYNLNLNKNLAQYDVLVEGFYTSLQDPFIQVSTGAVLPNCSILEEVRNGSGAEVFGVNLEFNYSPDPKFLFQSGLTFQQTAYNEPQVLFEPDNSDLDKVVVNSFVRNPDVYGFFNFSFMPNKHWQIDASTTYTGSMIVPRVINEDGFIELNQSQDFVDLNLRASVDFEVNESFKINLFGGVKNLFNSYQDDFDVGPTRDSDYIYGPAMPRRLFLGVKFGQF
ncbi:TonB-dependent receptor [Mesohalobacter halotolerans]|uniref:TonB-dependent receptor n=1 Tax=Mesohalobacter halotolerans TaxID=1883405 RepID=A0A4U5TQ50_9FLAO|nr:TonB-dependent receptor [Mesohalobacter halotolerans]MBS3738651.1 TonB-dependent receptor [Psychroflexus sp.]TKS56146.1 TonB-dependent receptor [Mesohalobacter halotolerans]